jgi:D-alanyl-D-alanine carboxypeptidase
LMGATNRRSARISYHCGRPRTPPCSTRASASPDCAIDLDSGTTSGKTMPVPRRLILTIGPAIILAVVAAPVAPTPSIRAERDLGMVRAVVVRAPQMRPSEGAATQRPPWKQRIDRLVAGKSFGIAVRLEGRVLYERGAAARRIPASNQKLLLSMALFDRFDAETRLTTSAGGRRRGSVVTGNLWIMGTGDPAVGSTRKYARSLPFRMTHLRSLARRIETAGIKRIRGGVVGGTGFFSRDWWAPGWKPEFPTYYVGLPSALTFNGNRAQGRFISDPELRAAAWLTRKLESLGVRVRRRPAASAAPSGLREIASIRSRPMQTLIRYMNFRSSNSVAEILGKRLSVARYRRPGTIAKGARAIREWVRRRGVGIETADSSGLSYRNRISARGMTRLLSHVEGRSWGGSLRRTLPPPGRGTLKDRLRGVQARAKTGTLENISTLSGWVWLRRVDAWASFSIMSSRLSKTRATEIENQIVRLLHDRAR